VATYPASQMLKEAREAPSRIAAQLVANQAVMEQVAERLLRSQPTFAATVARGSSDHACLYGKYLLEKRAGLFTGTMQPSLQSVYGVNPGVGGALVIAVSQSGASPDILAAVGAAQLAGATTVALVNDTTSPLAALADITVPLGAGPETSVAATKSYLCSLTALAHLVAVWQRDEALHAALHALPGQIEAALNQEWSEFTDTLLNAKRMLVIGRGPGFGAVSEMALKLKETCSLHAEAFSAAEVRHGPMAILEPDYPVLVLNTQDASQPSIDAMAANCVARGADVLSIGSAVDGAKLLPVSLPSERDLSPIPAVAAFYVAVNALSLARGLDPDRPVSLAKVTRTM
jgi:glutamine---fructose-6-phosphate transaminase (isomerizing)